MKSFEAMRRMVGGRAQEIAKRLKLSARLVYMWGEPVENFSSGSRSPLDRLEEAIDESLRSGAAQMDAFAPIQYLAHRFDGTFIPPVPVTNSLKDISKQTARAMKEAGEAFTKAAEILEDDCITPNERKDALKELYEAQYHLAQLTSMIEKVGGE